MRATLTQLRRRLIALALVALLAISFQFAPSAPAVQAHAAWNACSTTGWYEIWYSSTRYSDNIHTWHGSGPNGSYVIRHYQIHYPSYAENTHYVTCYT